MPIQPRNDAEAAIFDAMQEAGYIPFDTGGGASAWALPIGGPFASWVMAVDDDANLISSPQFSANLCIMEEASSIPSEWGGDWMSPEGFFEQFGSGWDSASVIRAGADLRYRYLASAWEDLSGDERSALNREWLASRIAVATCEKLKARVGSEHENTSFAEVAQEVLGEFFGSNVTVSLRSQSFEIGLITAAQQVAREKEFYRNVAAMFVSDWSTWSKLLHRHGNAISGSMSDLHPVGDSEFEWAAFSVNGLHFNDGTQDVVVFLDNVRVHELGSPKLSGQEEEIIYNQQVQSLK